MNIWTQRPMPLLGDLGHRSLRMKTLQKDLVSQRVLYMYTCQVVKSAVQGVKVAVPITRMLYLEAGQNGHYYVLSKTFYILLAYIL